jgi:hypothetical protein
METTATDVTDSIGFAGVFFYMGYALAWLAQKTNVILRRYALRQHDVLRAQALRQASKQFLR